MVTINCHWRQRHQHRNPILIRILYARLQMVLKTLLLQRHRAMLTLKRHRIINNLLILLQVPNILLQLPLLTLHLDNLLRQVVIHLQQRLVLLLQLDVLGRVHDGNRGGGLGLVCAGGRGGLGCRVFLPVEGLEEALLQLFLLVELLGHEVDLAGHLFSLFGPFRVLGALGSS